MSDIKAGTYKATATSAALDETENGKTYVQMDFEVPELGRKLSSRLYFVGGAIPFSLEKLKSTGWDGKSIGDLTTVGSKECTLEVKYEDYQGKQQLKVEIKSGGGGMKLDGKMNDQKRRAFVAEIDAMIKAGGGGSAPKPAATDDPIPF